MKPQTMRDKVTKVKQEVGVLLLGGKSIEALTKLANLVQTLTAENKKHHIEIQRQKDELKQLKGKQE